MSIADTPSQTWPDCPVLPCPWGDVFDRLTILRLKHQHMTDPARRRHVAAECAAVDAVIGDISRFPDSLAGLVEALAAVNAELWDIEDAIRLCEREERFDDAFVALARQVYLTNDRRAQLKRDISTLLGSRLIEQKLYAAHERGAPAEGTPLRAPAVRAR